MTYREFLEEELDYKFYSSETEEYLDAILARYDAAMAEEYVQPFSDTIC